jgi:hypothetical protein
LPMDAPAEGRSSARNLTLGTGDVAISSCPVPAVRRAPAAISLRWPAGRLPMGAVVLTQGRSAAKLSSTLPLMPVLKALSDWKTFPTDRKRKSVVAAVSYG